MAHFKFATSQARSIHQYKNLKIKVLKCNADIFFNRQCLTEKIIPNYANLNVPITSPASHITKNKIQTTRLKDEIKFLYKKKEKQNKELYHAHIKVDQEWGNLWYLILDSVHEYINTEMHSKYKNINQKLKNLEVTQTPSHDQHRSFHPHVVNQTNATFTPR